MATEKKEPRPPICVILSKLPALTRTPRTRKKCLSILVWTSVLVLNQSMTAEHSEGKGELPYAGAKGQPSSGCSWENRDLGEASDHGALEPRPMWIPQALT